MGARSKEFSGEGWRPLARPPDSDGSFRLPTSPFGRFAVAHAVSAAGDTLITIGLAQTLFFVSPDEARGRVILYLVLTLAPFAIVSPFIGPLVDRMAAQRKWVVVGAAVLRAVLCFLMARDTESLLLFPEAFATLVLSKGYAVTRSSLVPDVVANQSQLVRANSRLTIISGLAGFLIALPGGLLSHFGAPWVLSFGVVVFAIATFLATRIQMAERPVPVEPESSLDVVFDDQQSRSDERVRATAFRLAGIAMSVQRALVGFITFLVAFTFKDEGAPTWWLGLVAAAGVGGGLLGAAIAPRLRRTADEGRILLGSLVSVTVCCLLGVLWSGRVGAMFVAGSIGVGASISRLALMSMKTSHPRLQSGLSVQLSPSVLGHSTPLVPVMAARLEAAIRLAISAARASAPRAASSPPDTAGTATLAKTVATATTISSSIRVKPRCASMSTPPAPSCPPSPAGRHRTNPARGVGSS